MLHYASRSLYPLLCGLDAGILVPIDKHSNFSCKTCRRIWHVCKDSLMRHTQSSKCSHCSLLKTKASICPSCHQSDEGKSEYSEDGNTICSHCMVSYHICITGYANTKEEESAIFCKTCRFYAIPSRSRTGNLLFVPLDCPKCGVSDQGDRSMSTTNGNVKCPGCHSSYHICKNGDVNYKDVRSECFTCNPHLSKHKICPQCNQSDNGKSLTDGLSSKCPKCSIVYHTCIDGNINITDCPLNCKTCLKSVEQ